MSAEPKFDDLEDNEGWRAEIEERLIDIDSGRAVLIDGTEVCRRIRELLDEMSSN